MLEATRRWIQDVDTRVDHADPYPALRIELQGARDRITREGCRIRDIVAVDRESVRGAAPARNAGILDRDPQIVMRVLCDLLNEVAGQPVGGARRVGVAKQLMPVVANQPVLGPEPDEAL